MEQVVKSKEWDRLSGDRQVVRNGTGCQEQDRL